MTPTDTMTPIRPTPNNPTDPCLCGHSRRNHGKEDDREICFVCTHPTGGCPGFITELEDSTAGQRDAFLAGFHAGDSWGGPWGPHPSTEAADAAEQAYREWVEGPGEDA